MATNNGDGVDGNDQGFVDDNEESSINPSPNTNANMSFKQKRKLAAGVAESLRKIQDVKKKFAVMKKKHGFYASSIEASYEQLMENFKKGNIDEALKGMRTFQLRYSNVFDRSAIYQNENLLDIMRALPDEIQSIVDDLAIYADPDASRKLYKYATESLKNLIQIEDSFNKAKDLFVDCWKDFKEGNKVEGIKKIGEAGIEIVKCAKLIYEKCKDIAQQLGDFWGKIKSLFKDTPNETTQSIIPESAIAAFTEELEPLQSEELSPRRGSLILPSYGTRNDGNGIDDNHPDNNKPKLGGQ